MHMLRRVPNHPVHSLDTLHLSNSYIYSHQMKKGVFYSTKNQLVAILEESFCFTFNNKEKMWHYKAYKFCYLTEGTDYMQNMY